MEVLCVKEIKGELKKFDIYNTAPKCVSACNCFDDNLYVSIKEGPVLEMLTCSSCGTVSTNPTRHRWYPKQYFIPYTVDISDLYDIKGIDWRKKHEQ